MTFYFSSFDKLDKVEIGDWVEGMGTILTHSEKMFVRNFARIFKEYKKYKTFWNEARKTDKMKFEAYEYKDGDNAATS